jgi:hypothetical protein
MTQNLGQFLLKVRRRRNTSDVRTIVFVAHQFAFIDYNGNTHEVILTPGDMLFYESSKLWHGRPKRLNGSWYSSLFVHYYPKENWYDKNHELEAHYAVPPVYSDPPTQPRKHNRLKMVSTSMIEPDCLHEWCRVQKSIKWSGPGEEGVWIAPNGEKYPFNPQTIDHEEL